MAHYTGRLQGGGSSKWSAQGGPIVGSSFLQVQALAFVSGSIFQDSKKTERLQSNFYQTMFLHALFLHGKGAFVLLPWVKPQHALPVYLDLYQ